MEITIQGLSQKQMLFADILWGLNGQDEVDQFIRSLPKTQRREAEVVKNMMVAAVFDQISDTSMARELLKKF